MKTPIVFISLVVLAGCVNNYNKYYQPVSIKPHFEDAYQNAIYLNKGESPKVDLVPDIKKARQKMIVEGYLPVGQSSFVGRKEPDVNAIKQAKSVKATNVVLYSEHAGSVTQTSPLILPNANTTTYSGNAQVGSLYGAYSGSSTTTSTSIIPITTTIQRYKQAALFYVKNNLPIGLGLYVRDLSDEERVRYKRNTGAIVFGLRKGGPAFNNEVLKGDMIVEFDGIKVTDAAQVSTLFKSNKLEQRDYLLKVVRDSKLKTFYLKPNLK